MDELILHFSCFLALVQGFNIDTFYSLIYQVSSDEGTDTEERNYFGMSVAVRPNAAHLNRTWFVQIGAPRARWPDRPEVRNPGVVYRCRVHGPCQPVLFEKNFGSVGGEGAHLYRSKEDDAWMGSSMDIKKFGNFERTVVCGHRWINQNIKNSENIDLTYLMTGICYLEDLIDGVDEPNPVKLLPLVNSDKIYTPKPYVSNLSKYFWGLGQAGTSVLLTVTPPGVIIGAPGVAHWTGSVVRYRQDLSFSVGNFIRTEMAKKNYYTYLGYAVSFGRFYKDRKLWFVASAPRSANYRGEVLTFRYKDPTDYVQVQTTLRGSSLGEYFGSSVVADDLNGDGYDDLVIGAPLYSKRLPDEGRIYVYLGSGKGNFLVQSQIVNGQIRRGRFGSCVASLKDLDQDGYNDVAVGAPYENGQTGAVYIYRGFPLGLETVFVQRILAQNLNPHLRGFGISISGAVDVDGNKYNDVAIGAYLSGQVVLLRSRPIVSLHPQVITAGSSLIDRQATYFNISLCARYTGSNPPRYADVIQVVEVDNLHGRAVIRGSTYKRTIRLRSNEIFCETYAVELKNPGKNFSPLQVILSNELPACAKGHREPLLIGRHRTGEKDKFDKFCPIGRRNEIVKEISFAGVCGTDNVCISDVQLSCIVPEFLNGSYLLGSSTYFRLHVGLINSAEPAFNVKLKIWSNAKLNWRDDEDASGPKSPRKIFWRDLGGAFTDRFQMDFSLEIPLDKMSELEESELTVMAEVFISNADSNLDNNKCRFSVKLVSDATVSLYSSSSPSKFFASEDNPLDNRLNFSHFYEFEKGGVSPILEAEMTLYIPDMEGVELMTYEVETSDWAHVVREYQTNADLKLVPDDSNGNCQPEKTFFFNCSSSDVRCRVQKVVFPIGLPNGPSSYVRLVTSLNSSVFGDKEVVCLTTFALLRYRTVFQGPSREVRADATLVLVSRAKEKTVEGYVVALSVLSGGFILFLVTTCLARGNFFKRTKRDELKALKEAENCFVYFKSSETPIEC